MRCVNTVIATVSHKKKNTLEIKIAPCSQVNKVLASWQMIQLHMVFIYFIILNIQILKLIQGGEHVAEVYTHRFELIIKVNDIRT